jgi:circadian clock protein KaiB
MTGAGSAGRPSGEGAWRRYLHAAGRTPKALTAFENLIRICEEHLSGRYTIEVIELGPSPQRAAPDPVVAGVAPARRRPATEKLVIEDLSGTGKVLARPGLRSVA